MTKLKTTAAVTIAVVSIIAAGCGGGKSNDKTAVARPSANPPLYRQTHYDVETNWPQDASDRKVGHYLESVWHDPANLSSKLVIDSRASDGTAPPLAAAELAQIQANQLPEYHERSFKKVTIGGHPAIHWAFDVAGEGYIEYFFAECGTSIFLHGSTSLVSYEPFARFYGIAASSVKILCEG